MKRIFKILYILGSLYRKENRKKFLVALDRYHKLISVTQQPTHSDSDKTTEPDAKQSIDSSSTVIIENIVERPNYGKLLRLAKRSRFLLVIHELSLTGAPFAVLYLAQALKSTYNVKPIIISPKEGPLQLELDKHGLTTIVDPLLFEYKEFSLEVCGFVSNFENVIVSSLSSFGFVRNFRGLANNLTWWIHETETSFNYFANTALDLALLFASCKAIWLGSPLCMPYALQYSSKQKLYLLFYGCPDKNLLNRSTNSEKISFSIVGSIVPRKGQDILLAAIELLPESIKDKTQFRIIGSSFPEKSFDLFYKNLVDKAKDIQQVEFIETVPKDSLFELYGQTDVLVCCSIEDPMPIVVTEALMFSIPCICSSQIGQAKLIEDKKSGLIFSSGSAKDLSKILAWAVDNKQKLKTIGQAGRSIYEKYFLMETFTKNVRNLLEK